MRSAWFSFGRRMVDLAPTSPDRRRSGEIQNKNGSDPLAYPLWEDYMEGLYDRDRGDDRT